MQSFLRSLGGQRERELKGASSEGMHFASPARAKGLSFLPLYSSAKCTCRSAFKERRAKREKSPEGFTSCIMERPWSQSFVHRSLV